MSATIRVRAKCLISNEFLSNSLRQFAADNAALKSKDFKSAWENWASVNACALEKERAVSGDPEAYMEKLYHSARYYFRKDSLRKSNDPKYVAAPKFHTGVHLPLWLRELMDTHIEAILKEEIEDGARVKPADAFQEFLDTHAGKMEATLEELGTRAAAKGVGELTIEHVRDQAGRAYKTRLNKARHGGVGGAAEQ